MSVVPFLIKLLFGIFIWIISVISLSLQPRNCKTAITMETRKFKQVPSINQLGERNSAIPKPVIVNCGKKKRNYGRTITRSMHTNSRTISAGEPINWDEVYSGC